MKGEYMSNLCRSMNVSLYCIRCMFSFVVAFHPNRCFEIYCNSVVHKLPKHVSLSLLIERFSSSAGASITLFSFLNLKKKFHLRSHTYRT